MQGAGDADAKAGRDRVRDMSTVEGDVGALDADFSSFFSAHQEGLVRAMYLLTGDRLEAEELSQEALVRVYERWDEVAGMKSPTGYLYRTAINLNRRRLRRLLRFASSSLVHDVSGESDPEAIAVARTDVAEALLSLTRGQREVIMLREWLDLPIDELAEILSITPGSARVRLHRARQLLRKRLGGNHG
jgi:RNA polymerase sigma-70 factor (ECF subfamily)